MRKAVPRKVMMFAGCVSMQSFNSCATHSLVITLGGTMRSSVIQPMPCDRAVRAFSSCFSSVSEATKAFGASMSTRQSLLPTPGPTVSSPSFSTNSRVSTNVRNVRSTFKFCETAKFEPFRFRAPAAAFVFSTNRA